MQAIRPYRRPDLAAMVALDEVCFPPQFLFGRSSMRRFAESSLAKTFVAETVDNTLIAFVIVHMERRSSGLRGYVVTLDVAPSHRRTGVASDLMRSIEAHAADEGATSMELHVYIHNETAIHFYEGRGYQRMSVEEGFYGALGADAYVYQKSLQTAGLTG